MVVRVDEAGDDRGAFCVPGRRTLADQIAHVAIGSDGEKAAVLDRERVCARLPWIDGDDPGVVNDQVGGCGRRVFLRSRKKRRGDKARSGEREQIAAGFSVGHLSKAPERQKSQSQHELLLVLESITSTGRINGQRTPVAKRCQISFSGMATTWAGADRRTNFGPFPGGGGPQVHRNAMASFGSPARYRRDRR